MGSGNLQYVYRWRIGQWGSLAPCVEHNSPAFDADGLRWVFKLFKGRARNPQDLALYLAVHESSTPQLKSLRKKVDVSFTLENLRTRGLDYNKYTAPITVWVDSAYSTWGDDKFISLEDAESFLRDDTASLVVRLHVRETVQEGPPPASQPSPAIAVYVPEKIAAPFNRLLRSARFSDIQFALRDSASLLLSPGPPSSSAPQGLLSPRNSGDFRAPSAPDALRIGCSGPPSPPLCVTPMPGDCCARPLPYAQHARVGGAPPPLPAAGPRYHAHRAILMAVSPVFEAMFSNGMRETYERVVEVWDVTPRAFERLLEFAYTHECDLSDSVSAEEVVETLLCADQFDVAGLRDRCWRSLMSRLAVDTVWDLWSIAKDLEATEQQRACRVFCCRNFTELCHAPSTMWASAHLLREVLASDSLNVASEELLFETVVRWANFREDGSDATTSPPMSAADSAVLRCYRSPSNLALLPPRSPWAARARRKPELTREAYTSAQDANAGRSTAPPTPATPATPAVAPSPRLSVAAPTTPQSDPLSASSSSAIWSSLSERKNALTSLLPCIRFPMMDKNFLLRVVERNAELMALPLMKDLLIEAYRFHAFNPPPPQPAPPVTPVLQKISTGNAANRRSSEGFARKEYTAQLQSAPPQPVYAKIILPLNTADDLALSRSQRRKQVHKLAIQNVSFVR